MADSFKLKNGSIFLSTEAPGGIYNSTQLKKIAELCSQDLAIVKATEDQRLALFVKEDEADTIAQELEAVGLGFRHYQAGLHQPVSCIGELCEQHEQDALGSAMDLSRELEELSMTMPLKIGINGCALCCTPCHTLDISVIGEANGYRISLGGKGSQVPELAAFMAEGVPADKLSGLIRAVVDLYMKKAEEDESLLDVLHRCGVSDFVSALAPYSQDAAGVDDPLSDFDPAAGLQDIGSDDLQESQPPVAEVASEGDPELDDLDNLEDLDNSSDELSQSESDDLSLDLVEDSAPEGPSSLTDESFDLTDDDLETDDTPASEDELGEDLIIDDSDELLSEADSTPPVETDTLVEAPEASEPAAEDLAEASDFEDDLDDISLDDDLSPADDIDSLHLEEADDLAPVLEDDVELDEIPIDDDVGEIGDEISVDEAAKVPDPTNHAEAAKDEELIAMDEGLDNLADETLDDSAMIEEDLTGNPVSAAQDDELEAFEDDLDTTADSLSTSDDELVELTTEDELAVDDMDLNDDALAFEESEVVVESQTEVQPVAGEISEEATIDGDDITDEERELLLADADDFNPPELVTDTSTDLESSVDDDLLGTDELEDAEMLSEEDESDFEARLSESIEEEAKLMADAEPDINVAEREQALGMLDDGETQPIDQQKVAVAQEIDSDTLDEPEQLDAFDDDLGEMDDFALEEIETDELALDDLDSEVQADFTESSAPTKLTKPSTRAKVTHESFARAFKFAGIDIDDSGNLHLSFESGAFLDIDVSNLKDGDEKSFTIAGQTFVISQNSQGYMLEVDGVRIFYPKADIQAAS